MADRIVDPWGEHTPFARGNVWPVRVDAQLADGLDERDVDRWVQSASLLHSNGDATRHRGEGRADRRRPRPSAPTASIAAGSIPKDLFGWQANHHPDRLTRPLVREAGELVDSDWETALGRIIERSRALLDGPGGWGRFGFYTTGQLFLEEYYTLAVIGKAGIGTPHMDDNTRLCTATAAAALKASFGSDGQPGVIHRRRNHRDTLALWGHNVAETQAVLWMRMLDRLHGRDRPRLVVADPRTTPAAREADVHLPVRSGTNQALMNGILRELIERGWIDEPYDTAPHARVRRAGSRQSRRTRSHRVAATCGVDVGRHSRPRPRSWGPASGCSRPCCRVSTSPTRRRRPPARSSTCTCCAGCSGCRAPACCR